MSPIVSCCDSIRFSDDGVLRRFYSSVRYILRINRSYLSYTLEKYLEHTDPTRQVAKLIFPPPMCLVSFF